MSDAKLRQQIVQEAARLMYERAAPDYAQARRQAVRAMGAPVGPEHLPTNAEIREQIEAMADVHAREGRREGLRALRLAALQRMRRLAEFQPRLTGDVLTGDAEDGEPIELELFTDEPARVAATLEGEGLAYSHQQQRIRRHDAPSVFRYLHHFHFEDGAPFHVTVYAENQAHLAKKNGAAEKGSDGANIAQLERLLEELYPSIDLDLNPTTLRQEVDRFVVYESLLAPLEHVKQNRQWHPEGDALYHSLQVFDRARDELPYDEEFLLAALLHDVGKAIDPSDHVAASLEAIRDVVTERTYWLVEHLKEAQAILDGAIGARARRRLEASPDFEELMLLARCDRAGRVRGAKAPDLHDALKYLRELEEACG